jgi:plastocyanin
MSLSRTIMLALAVASGASAKVFHVSWDYTPKARLAVNVGDIVKFNWLSEFHDVHIHPTLDCTETGSIGVQSPATQGGSARYTFTAEDALPGGHDMFFASDIYSHCDANAHLAVTVFPVE